MTVRPQKYLVLRTDSHFSTVPSSKTGGFEDGLTGVAIIFQEVGTNLQMSADKTLYICGKLKVGILTWTEETF